MTEYMNELKQDDPNAMLNPQQYFELMKEKKNIVTSEDLKKIYDNCLELANKYRITGQVRGLRKNLVLYGVHRKRTATCRYGNYNLYL